VAANGRLQGRSVRRAAGPAPSLHPVCKRNVGIFNPASRWVMTRRKTNGSARGSALLRDRFKIILGVVNMAERSGASPYHWSGIVKATEDNAAIPPLSATNPNPNEQ